MKVNNGRERHQPLTAIVCPACELVEYHSISWFLEAGARYNYGEYSIMQVTCSVARMHITVDSLFREYEVCMRHSTINQLSAKKGRANGLSRDQGKIQERLIDVKIVS
jgi:hypothetical protein